jgi:hypothetical protein
MNIAEMHDGDFIDLYRYIRKLYINRQEILALHFKKVFKVGDTVKILSGDRKSSYEGMIGVISKLNPKMVLIVLAKKRNPEYKEVFSGRAMINLKCPYILIENLEDKE